jgi:hypothetical protein
MYSARSYVVVNTQLHAMISTTPSSYIRLYQRLMRRSQLLHTRSIYVKVALMHIIYTLSYTPYTSSGLSNGGSSLRTLYKLILNSQKLDMKDIIFQLSLGIVLIYIFLIQNKKIIILHVFKKSSPGTDQDLSMHRSAPGPEHLNQDVSI